jgi:hypothetical protein
MEDQVLRENQGCQVLVSQDFQAQKEKGVFQENQEFLELQGRKVLQVCLAFQDFQEPQ